MSGVLLKGKGLFEDVYCVGVVRYADLYVTVTFEFSPIRCTSWVCIVHGCGACMCGSGCGGWVWQCMYVCVGVCVWYSLMCILCEWVYMSRLCLCTRMCCICVVRWCSAYVCCIV